MKRVLIVEDDKQIREALAQALEHEGYKVHLASDGEAALHLLDSMQLPDVILTDLQMHPMGGRTFLNKVRENSILKNIPVVVLTAEEKTKDLGEIVLKKPFELDRLLHAIVVAQRSRLRNGGLAK